MTNRHVQPVAYHDNRPNGESPTGGVRPIPRFVLAIGALVVREALPAGTRVVLFRNPAGGIEYVGEEEFFGTTAGDGGEMSAFRKLLGGREEQREVPATPEV